MSLDPLLRQLYDDSDALINHMSSDWTAAAIPMGQNLHLCIHIFWDDPAVTGTLTLEYSADSTWDGSPVIEDWVEFNVVNLDGTFSNVMFLDKDLPISSFRLRFDHISGTANMKAYVKRMRA